MKVKSKEKLFEGAIFDVVEKTMINDEGKEIKRQIVEKQEVCVILAINEKTKNYIVTEEYRSGSESKNIGFPAGHIDEGETPRECAIRELKEETGYGIVGEPKYLGHSYASQGFTNEKIHYFLATVDGNRGEQELDGDEEIDVMELSSDEIINKVINGEIVGSHAHTMLLKVSLLNY